MCGGVLDLSLWFLMGMMNLHNNHGFLRERHPDGSGMDLFEANTHPFIVKVWLEQSAQEADHAIWRGHITHVPTGERRYLQDLSDIEVFIALYLEQMGVRLGPFWRVRRWVKQRTQRLARHR